MESLEIVSQLRDIEIKLVKTYGQGKESLGTLIERMGQDGLVTPDHYEQLRAYLDVYGAVFGRGGDVDHPPEGALFVIAQIYAWL